MSKFNLGQAVMTRGIAEEMEQNKEFAEFVRASFIRHSNGDWGDLGEEDKQANKYALENDLRIFSAYIREDKKIYIITEWDRSATTILFPSEY